jgi:hypothetical protein
MRANTTPSGPLLNGSGSGPVGYHHSNGYSSAPNHSQQHSPYAQSHSVSNRGGRISDGSSGSTGAAPRPSQQQMAGGDRMNTNMPLSNSNQLNSPYAVPAPGVPLKQRNASPLKGEIEEQGPEGGLQYSSWTYRGDPFNRQ